MTKFIVRAYAVDWCGYESDFTIEADSEEDALDRACQELADEYDLLPTGDGMYGEFDDFDEDGKPLEDVELTSISARILSEDE